MNNDRQRLFNLIYGYIGTHLVSAACKLDLFDALSDQTLTSVDLATRMAVDEHSLRRLMKALSGLGLLNWQPPNIFSATPMGALLASTAESSMRTTVETGFDGLTRDRAWHALPQAIRNGGIPFDIGIGESFFSYLERNPEYQQTFYAAMDSSISKVLELAQKVDFGRFRRVLDIGGGGGTLVQAIRARFPELDCAVFDRPAMAATATKSGIPAISGDFLASIPADFDCYMLSRILDDWDDRSASVILRNVRNACQPGATLLVLQPVTAANDASSDAMIADINMLVYNGRLQALGWRAEQPCKSSWLPPGTNLSTGARAPCRA
jgi:hypothetical protein